MLWIFCNFQTLIGQKYLISNWRKNNYANGESFYSNFVMKEKPLKADVVYYLPRQYIY